MNNYIITSDGSFISEDELRHWGVKGMKWGVRRYQNEDGSLTKAGKKHQAKEEYRDAKREAASKLGATRKKADERYAKAMSKRNDELNKIDEDYSRTQKSIDSYYKRELSKHQNKLDKDKSDMDFWGEGNVFYNEAASRYEQHYREMQDTQHRYDQKSYANKMIRDNAKIKVKDLYYDSSKKASEQRQASYVKAGQDYLNDMKLAKIAYKEAKKNIKN